MGSTGWAGDSRNASISSLDSRSCGWNMFARYFANTAALSLSLFAHLSGFGVSKSRGGDASVGLREDLMGFQTELSYRQTAVFFLFLFHCSYSHLYFYYPLTTCSILYISIGIGYRKNFTIHLCTPCIYCLSNKSKKKNRISSK